MADRLLYGAAYYPEYLSEDRIDEDMRLMTQAGFNVIRIAESTWSTWEPRDGEFDFTLLRRVLHAAREHGLSVIVGTPTYAIPPWLARKHPDILSDTHGGPCRYGPRQNFDLTHPAYRSHAERIIRRLMEQVCGEPCVIGYQLDNETKPYDTCSPRAQKQFRLWLKECFGAVEELNRRMGLAFWSNSLGSWEDLPDVRGTVNASLGAEYQAFQRHLVTEFLLWQRRIVDEYRRPDQFVTHNFDYEWRSISFGLQPEVDQFEAAEAVTVAGCDIYHPTADRLTGAEIAFGGALARGLKGKNYFVLETQAQGNLGWLPYPGQLRLQALAHLASGADCLEYWHWHSIHNSFESYWKGVLSHDLTPGETYREAAALGEELRLLSPRLCHLQKRPKVAVMVSSRSQAGFAWFPTCLPGRTPEKHYSDYLRWICDSLYRLNVEYDLVPDTLRDFTRYDLLILPCLYAAADDLAPAVSAYVEAGGNLLATFRTAFADPYLKIRAGTQPYGLTECLGLRYDRFTLPTQAELCSQTVALPEHAEVTDWMELPELRGAEAVCTYRHPVWGGVPAVTCNRFGAGQAAYLACCFSPEALDRVLRDLLPRFGLELPEETYPLIRRTGFSQAGTQIDVWLNFSAAPQSAACPYDGVSLPDGLPVARGARIRLAPWGAAITERNPNM